MVWSEDVGQGEWCGGYYCHHNLQLTGHIGESRCNDPISQEIYAILPRHFPFKETRGMFSCGILVWIIQDRQIGGMLENSFILFLCQRHY